MEVRFSPDLEARINRAAAQKDSNPGEYVQQIVEQYLDHEAWFVEQVRPFTHCGVSTTLVSYCSRNRVNAFSHAANRDGISFLTMSHLANRLLYMFLVALACGSARAYHEDMVG